MIRDLTTTVAGNRDLGGGHHLVAFDAPEIVREMRPGQFFMIGIPGSEVLLRRPFSVCGLPGTFDDGGERAVQVLYKVVGRGTALLAAIGPGAPLTVLGPLGRGFEPPRDPRAVPVFVAGGIGSAPFPALAVDLEREGRGKPVLFYGARTATDLPLLDWFRGRCRDVVVTTEDGTAGERALVTRPLMRFLDERGNSPIELYACGPEPMLRAISSLAVERGLSCQLSLEAHMACGFGVCIGCVVPTRAEDGGTTYERVCIEGPVMRAERLAW